MHSEHGSFYQKHNVLVMFSFYLTLFYSKL